jgi:hypothetical protein
MRLVLVVGLFFPVAFPVAARATDLPCGPAESGAVRLDGLTEDWVDVPGVDVGGRDSNLSFTIKCNIDPGALYLLVDVRDNYFARTQKGRPGEDHVELTFAGKKLIVFPGDAASIKDRLVWSPSRPAKGIKIASALQQHGWAVELGMPLNEVPGYRRGAPIIQFSAQVDDCDSKATGQTERTLAMSGDIAFAEADSALDAFLGEQGLSRSAIYFDRSMSSGHGTGARAVLAGRFLVFLTDGYVYEELPFRDRKDLRDARLVDLAGDGRDALVLRYLERSHGGTREVLAAYRPEGAQLTRVFAAEVGKSTGGGRVEDKVSFVRRGRATDLLVEAGAATGVTQASYREAPASDMIPVLLPWADVRRTRYQFSGSEYREAR